MVENEVLRVLTFGNPMVDMILHVSIDFVQSYDLIHGESVQAHVSNDDRMRLLETVLNDPNVVRTTGGSALNTARTIQIFTPPKSAIFVGAVGDDSNGLFLHDASANTGVEMHFQIRPNLATSTCICLITPDHERTLVVQRSAHVHYTLDENYLDVLKQVDIIYIVSFVLSSNSRYECAKYAAAHRQPSQLLCMNLSSANLFQNPDIVNRLLALLPSCSLLLGNDAEFQALGEALQLTSMETPYLAQKILMMYLAPHAMAVITCADQPTWVVQAATRESFVVDIPELFQIQDTNGAGDAFVGGFLAGIMHHASTKQCIELGHLCAVQCVQEEGCHIHFNEGCMARVDRILSNTNNSLYKALL